MYIVVTFDQKRVADGRQKGKIATAKQVLQSTLDLSAIKDKSASKLSCDTQTAVLGYTLEYSNGVYYCIQSIINYAMPGPSTINVS